MRSLKALTLAFLLATGVHAPAAAQKASRSEAKAAAAEVARLVARDYVYEARRAPLVHALKTAPVTGESVDAREFAESLTLRMRAVSPDKHLRMSWSPDEYRRLAAEQRPSSGPTSAEAGRWAVEARRSHHGISDQRLLAGNVRIVRITDFWWEAGSREALERAVAFLQDADALIIDLRGNGGGSPEAVQFLISHFMPADTLLMTARAPSGKTEQRRSLAVAPGRSLAGRPLYVLVDGVVGSAGEEFAYHVAQFRLGRLVGSTTDGAANHNALYPIAPGFVLSLSVASPTHPVSGGNWEGTGVPADVPAAPGQEEAVAHVLALESLRDAAQGSDRTGIEWALEGARAALKPYQPTTAELQAAAGSYEDRQLAYADGSLIYRRPDRTDVRLRPLARGLFQLGSTETRLRLVDGPRPSAIELSYSDGTVRRFARAPR